MSLSDAERDALEQLQEAIENGDVSLLRTLLNHCRRLNLVELAFFSLVSYRPLAHAGLTQ